MAPHMSKVTSINKMTDENCNLKEISRKFLPGDPSMLKNMKTQYEILETIEKYTEILRNQKKICEELRREVNVFKLDVVEVRRGYLISKNLIEPDKEYEEKNT